MSAPWRVLVGIDYADDTRRAEPGDIVTDLPYGHIRSLQEQGVIEGPVAIPAPGDAEDTRPDPDDAEQEDDEVAAELPDTDDDAPITEDDAEGD